MKNNRKSIELLEISEEPLLTPSWKKEDILSWQKALENDIRSLKLQLAQSKFSLAEQEKSSFNQMKKLLLEMISVLDSFEHIFSHIEKRKDLITGKTKNLISNFRVTYKLLKQILHRHGVVKVEIIDNRFDPAWHNPIEVVKDVSKMDGTILKELKPGYVWQKTILRQTEVRIVNNVSGKEPMQTNNYKEEN